MDNKVEYKVIQPDIKHLVDDITTIQSTTAVNWYLDPLQANHPNRCRPEFGIIGGTNVSHTSSNIVDVENELYGITRTASRCNQYKYQPITVGQKNFHQPKYIKPVENPVLDLNMHHLNTCNFADYQVIPKQPNMQFDK